MRFRPMAAIGFALIACLPGREAAAQFRDDFDALALDPEGRNGWAFFPGDGTATMDVRQGGAGYASVLVDATSDKRGIWWALIERNVSEKMDLGLLRKAGHELRIEARIRVSHAPRRVNLQVLTQRTTDYHSHLMEFDIPDTESWHTISMTTRGFEAGPGDTLIGHLALMDWGLEKYRVDLDYIKVDIVDVASAGPDQGAAVPYHPPLRDPGSFAHEAPAAHDSMIDVENTGVNFDDWYALDGARRVRLLAVSGTRYAILRFELGAAAGRRAAGSGQLELTTHSLGRKGEDVKDFGIVRVVEILGGDPDWNQKTVTTDSLCKGQPLNRVLNTQMILDWPVTEGDGGKTYLTIPKPVMQRLLDGKTLGIAIKPLGAIDAAFYALENEDRTRGARLRFDLEK